MDWTSLDSNDIGQVKRSLCLFFRHHHFSHTLMYFSIVCIQFPVLYRWFTLISVILAIIIFETHQYKLPKLAETTFSTKIHDRQKIVDHNIFPTSPARFILFTFFCLFIISVIHISFVRLYCWPKQRNTHIYRKNWFICRCYLNTHFCCVCVCFWRCLAFGACWLCVRQ